MNPFRVLLYTVTLLAAGCADTSLGKKTESTESPDPIFSPVSLPPGFNEYWYRGQAELSTYDVEQERYGEIRRAEQVNVFVTEDFSRSKQVKLDDPLRQASDRLPVLKFNSLRRFQTGIYDYSLMLSTFTPVTGHPTVKSTASIQDWCGQVFLQGNLTDQGYRFQTRSYFETEGDREEFLPQVWLEDELWARIRLQPDALPAGKIKIIPAFWYTRLAHKPLLALDAEVRKTRGSATTTLEVSYPTVGRLLKIEYDNNFPFRIQGWEERLDGNIMSKGRLKAVRMGAYWAEHSEADAPLRDSLNLEMRR